MKIKEVALNEIFWSIQNWNRGTQANTELKKLLGETSQYFAEGKVGSNFFEWQTNNLGDWQPMTAANEAERASINQKIGEISTTVREKLPEDIADRVLEVPNEGYIFFKPAADGKIDVIITGWGFRNFKKAPPFMIKTPKRQPTKPNTISFVINGERQLDRAFTLRANYMNEGTQQSTGPEGVYTLQAEAGVQVEVTDLLTDRKFNITVSNESPNHELDLTEWANITVQATIDGQPLSNESVSIDYAGQHYDLELVDGQALLDQVVLHEGQTLTASLRGEKQEITIGKTDNVVTFAFTTPDDDQAPETQIDESEPEPQQTARLTVLDHQGQPMRGAQFVLRQGEVVIQGTLDDQGQALFVTNCYTLEQPLSADITTGNRQFEPIAFNLEKDETDYVLQENAPKDGSRLLEILLFLLLLAALACLVIFVIKPCMPDLVRSISRSIF